MELQDIVFLSTCVVGFVFLCKSFLRVLRWGWSMFLRPPKDLVREYGSWAVVTGATDGIGKALAFELASKGLHLVLVGRNPSKLQATSSEIRQKHDGKVQNLQIKSIVIDFARSRAEEVSRMVEEGTKGLDVGILINNAGVAYPYATFFHEVDEELLGNLIRVNVEASTWVTKSVLPRMMERKRGLVINIGSASSTLPSCPLLSVYAATKSYLAAFSKCIALEYRQYGIDIQCQVPFFVSTKMTRMKRSLAVPTAEEYSKASIRWFGYDHMCTPHWSHSALWAILRFLPDTLVDWGTFLYLLRISGFGLNGQKISHFK